MTTVSYIMSVGSMMLGVGIPLLQLQWLQLCTYKIQIHVQVQVLIHLLSCFFSRISVVLVAGIVLLSALSSICGAVLVMLPGQLEKVR